MTVVTAQPFAISGQNEILQEIQAEDCSLAIWQRDVPVDVRGLLQNDRENLRISVASQRPGSPLRKSLHECGYPDNATTEKLIEDILMLCDNFRELTASPSIEIRLEVVSGNSCWKFHSDYVEMRLISTYLGRGTQWIDDREADRLAEGLEPEKIIELGTGDVGLFKGRICNGRPAIHRSPPVNETSEKRLLLVLNPIPD